MKKIFLLILFYSQLPTANCQLKNYWQQQTDYTINVSLNDIEHTLDGFEKIKYTNNSPDTISFIWFHLWPNAYKNDRTAFSEQLLQNGRTDFYFSDKEQRGYINRLDFRINGTQAKTEDHPLYIDVVKVVLPQPLMPGNQIEITTPFHEKLPFNFSRGGHVGQSYQITQWFPKPAVYDQKGWHEMPYLDQGEFYSEFGNFDVRITVPENYVIAATGELQNEDEKNWLINKSKNKEQEISIKAQEIQTIKKKKYFLKTKKEIEKLNPKPIVQLINPTATQTKTLIYKQNNIHDFAWFADKNFIVNADTLQLASGKIINVYSFYLPNENNYWKNSIQFIKDAVHFRSSLIGEYPYQTVSAVEAKMGFAGGMEYPTITSISPVNNEKELDLTIEHEVGHNWFYGILGSNERRYPWMDEGINTYYDKRYEEIKYKQQEIKDKEQAKNNWLKNKQSDDRDKMLINVLTKEKIDQPISTSSEDFNEINYNLIAYSKTGLWMKQLEDMLGKKLFDSCMHQYFIQWQFKHPYPENFKTVIEQTSNKNLNAQFSLLDKKGALTNAASKKIKPTFLFSQKNTDKISYINFAPAVGYNMYDKFMIGAIIHNINTPPENFQFVLAPLYATNSKQFNGIGDIAYSWYPDNTFQKIEISLSGARFSTSESLDTTGKKIFENFNKLVPALRFYFKHTPRSTLTSYIDMRTYIIKEKKFDKFGIIAGGDSTVSYPLTSYQNTRYINQLTFNVTDIRVLYPYDYQLQLQQGAGFYRVNLTGNYFFNYSHGGGLNVRLFAAKFGYIGGPNSDTYLYQPKLLAESGDDDYTYSNYFLGRSAAANNPPKPIANDGIAAQQIMIRDGGLKLRMDLSPFLQGQSQNWVAAMNFNTTLPNNLFPKKLPLLIFFDIGSYAEAWGSNPQTAKFLYVGGLQLSLLKKIINIYAPLVYSSDFSNTLKSFPQQNTFWKKISFSIDVQNINFKKIFRNTPF